MSRATSFALILSRLSYSFFPLASAITSLANPLSEMNNLTGIKVNPLSCSLLAIFLISFRCSNNFRSRSGS